MVHNVKLYTLKLRTILHTLANWGPCMVHNIKLYTLNLRTILHTLANRGQSHVSFSYKQAVLKLKMEQA